MSGEWVLAINWGCNWFSLWSAARRLRLPPSRRLLPVALLGAAAGMAAWLPGMDFLGRWPALLALPVLMGWGAYPRLSVPMGLRLGGYTLLTGLLLSGVCALAWRQGVEALAAIPLGGAVIAFFSVALKAPPGTNARCAQVEIALRGTTLRLCAMLDTGNLLTDPVSGLPVIVCSRRALLPLIPFAAFALEEEGALPQGFRLLSVRTCAGRGMMLCFRPDGLRLERDGAWQPCQAMVGIAPAPYDGMQALVPAALL